MINLYINCSVPIVDTVQDLTTSLATYGVLNSVIEHNYIKSITDN
jgi:hypothetical protein